VILRCWLPPSAFPRLTMLQFATRLVVFGMVSLVSWLVAPWLWLIGLFVVAWPVSFTLEFSQQQLVVRWLMWRATVALSDLASVLVVEDPRWGVLGKRQRILEVRLTTGARFHVYAPEEALVRAAAWIADPETAGQGEAGQQRLGYNPLKRGVVLMGVALLSALFAYALTSLLSRYLP
jgi:hypothetical protein